jgi:hypothetical protein
MNGFAKGFCEGSVIYLALWFVFGFVMMNWDVTTWNLAERLLLVCWGGIAFNFKFMVDRV